MDIDDVVPYTPAVGDVPQNHSTILCYNCGAPIDGTVSAGALCDDCIKLTVDISAGITRESNMQFCRDCNRWLLPPNSWAVAQPESRELLAICLKKLHISKVRVVDAKFIWTEPHSRRIKVKLTVQDSVAHGVLLQQSFEVTYVVSTHQCPDCKKSFTANVWRASVQVRQKVHHKRTFMFLEQLIMQHGAHRETLNIKEARDGIDFFFAEKSHAESFVHFLESVVPVDVKSSKELISADIHTSTFQYKFSWSAKIVPVCKDDLVAIPIKLARSLGNISPFLLCYRIGTAIYLLDPNTLQTAELSGRIYWRAPFLSLADAKQLVEFVILDIESTPIKKGKWHLCEATVARASDLGHNDVTYFTRTHLGHLLQPGDSAMGYLIAGSNYNEPNFDAIEANSTYASMIPDVVLVKKHFPNRKKNQKRKWKLKHMVKDEDNFFAKTADPDKENEDYEMFLREVEEDEEMRAAIALYKAKKKDDEMSVVETDDGDDDDVPKINVDDLLDDFEDLTVHDGPSLTAHYGSDSD
ncbi:probable nuclear export sequence-containing nonribosomal protein [Cephalotrichum gorgonifer]|uniref:60S ribosomal export protein NMD3 n=1 Tax=Cephalotrichum gorgonifer TaxID=2041049 RepID=A0AAE8SVX3_9PEZI|nr:probable nuclear export sequence-containing nonribosomal protein [Cephalotrichum gorgonifer]